MIQRTWWPHLNRNAQLAKGLVFAGLGGGASTLQYADASGYGNHGTLSGNTLWTFSPALNRFCTYFDGDQDRITVPGARTIKALAFWTNHPHGGGLETWGGFLFDARVGGGTGFVYVNAYSASNNVLNKSSGTWYCQGTTLPYYADNIWVSHVVNGITTSITASGFYIGQHYNNHTSDYIGYLGDYLAWDRSLTLAEIQQLADPSNTLLSGLILPPRRMVFPAAAGGAYSLDCDSIAFTLSSMAPDLLVGHVLDAAAGEFTLTGQDAGLEQGYALSCDAGSFTLTGQDATLTATRTLSCDSGEFVLTGQDASLESGATLSAESGSFTLTGQDASLLVGHVLDAGSGEFTLTGQDATLTYTPAGAYTITADAGSFSLTGQDATLTATRTLSCYSGTFTLTGQDATFQHGYTLACDATSFTLTGQDTSFQRALALACNAGAFTLTGQTVTLTYSAAIGSIYGTWTPPARSRTWTPPARSRTWTPQSRGN